MMFSWIFIPVLIIWGIWYFGKGNDSFLRETITDDPIDILKRRFANGEITEEEYEEKITAL